MNDPLTPKQRAYCMSRVRGKDTRPETLVRSALHRRGLRFRKHVKELPGRPDIVFLRARTVVFIDGDFWHGYEYEKWAAKLSPFWHRKIGDNIERDSRNFNMLLSMGWRVLRVWQHDVKKRFDATIEELVAAIRDGGSSDFDIHRIHRLITRAAGEPGPPRVSPYEAHGGSDSPVAL